MDFTHLTNSKALSVGSPSPKNVKYKIKLPNVATIKIENTPELRICKSYSFIFITLGIKLFSFASSFRTLLNFSAVPVYLNIFIKLVIYVEKYILIFP